MNEIIVKSNQKLTHKACVEKIGISRIDGKTIYKIDLNLILDKTRAISEELGTKNFEIITDLETEKQTI